MGPMGGVGSDVADVCECIWVIARMWADVQTDVMLHVVKLKVCGSPCCVLKEQGTPEMVLSVEMCNMAVHAP